MATPGAQCATLFPENLSSVVSSFFPCEVSAASAAALVALCIQRSMGKMITLAPSGVLVVDVNIKPLGADGGASGYLRKNVVINGAAIARAMRCTNLLPWRGEGNVVADIPGGGRIRCEPAFGRDSRLPLNVTISTAIDTAGSALAQHEYDGDPLVGMLRTNCETLRRALVFRGVIAAYCDAAWRACNHDKASLGELPSARFGAGVSLLIRDYPACECLSVYVPVYVPDLNRALMAKVRKWPSPVLSDLQKEVMRGLVAFAVSRRLRICGHED